MRKNSFLLGRETFLSMFLLMTMTFCSSLTCMAQNSNSIVNQAYAIAEANTRPTFLACTNSKDVSHAYFKFINNFPFTNYYILGYKYVGKSYTLKLPITDSKTFVGENKNFRFDLLNLLLTDLESGLNFRFKVLGQGNGADIQVLSGNPYNNNSTSSAKKTCTLCNGKGWISGSHTPTYGATGTHWCNKCNRKVNASHSHDRCPSCGGLG